MNDLRPEVVAFAVAMEKELRENDHKGGWKTEGISYFIEKLHEEVNELTKALGDIKATKRRVLSEAADVANIAMMLADIRGSLNLEAVFEPVFLVAVKHYNKGISSETFWFKTDSKLAGCLTPMDWVLVDTCYGPATGRVMQSPIMVTRAQDLRSLMAALKTRDLMPVLQKIEYDSIDDEMPF